MDVPPKLIIIRSFDINKPGCTIDNLKGGVVGGSLIEGILKVGDIVEIRPGKVERDGNKILKCKPFITKIINIRVEESNKLKYAIPGGLIGIETYLDP